jgi:MoxR-like ATPase
MKTKSQELTNLFVAKFGELATISRANMLSLSNEHGYSYATFKEVLSTYERVSHGKYRLPTKAGNTAADLVSQPKAALAAQVIKMSDHTPKKFDPNAESSHSYAHVPDADPLYVPFGEYETVRTILKSYNFYPVFISGMSGNGKTYMIEQAAARADRLLIRVQMSRETDEDDLIGGFRLIAGETKFIKGPAIRAMELGAILLIDEADRADPSKIMCLQGILEGKPYYVKKTGEIVKPASGFNVIVTANTKGRGSEDGRYVAASILDDAWLERFPATIEQQYPDTTTERRILKKHFESLGFDNENDFIEKLIKWAEMTRKSFEENVVDDLITTRRLGQIAKTYSMFKDRLKSIQLTINRFDKDTRDSFIELYKKLDESVVPTDPSPVNTNNGSGPTVHVDPDF